MENKAREYFGKKFSKVIITNGNPDGNFNERLPVQGTFNAVTGRKLRPVRSLIC